MPICNLDKFSNVYNCSTDSTVSFPSLEMLEENRNKISSPWYQKVDLAAG